MSDFWMFFHPWSRVVTAGVSQAFLVHFSPFHGDWSFWWTWGWIWMKATTTMSVYLQNVPMTTVIAPFGLFLIPSGSGLVWRRAAETFQQLMDSMLSCLSFLFISLDDIIFCFLRIVRLIPCAAHLIRPLYEALRAGGLAWMWTGLSRGCRLVQMPKWLLPAWLCWPILGLAFGEVYEQWLDDDWQPLAFFSNSLTTVRASTAHLTQNSWLFFLRHSICDFCWTAASSLPLWATSLLPLLGPTLHSSNHFISEFTTDIHHVVGNNPVADCLSLPSSTPVTRCGLYCCGRGPAADYDIQAFRSAVSGLQLKDVVFQDSGTMVLSNVSTDWVMLPTGSKHCVFDEVHDLSHLGVRGSVKLVGTKII